MKKAEQKFPWHLLLIFLVLSLSIWAAGYHYYNKEKEVIKKEKQEDLLAIADLKVKQIQDWRKERLSDAMALFDNPFFIKPIQQYMQSASQGIRQEVLSTMDTMLKLYQYKSVILLDAQGHIKLAVPGGKEILGPDAKRLTAEAFNTEKVIFSDLYRSKITNAIHLTVVVPLLAERGQGTIPIGVLLLRNDPHLVLYPLIQTWPTLSRTAETIMVRREGDDVVYLNELRHKKGTALTLRYPLTQKDLPAAMALRGIEGIVEGIDYRGVPVLAALKRVPDSRWYLIVKVDREEIYAPIRHNLWVTSLFVSIMIFAAGGFIGFLWRHQEAVFYQERYGAEQKHLAFLKHFEYLTQYANDIILLSDKNMRIIEVNDRASMRYGYTGDELTQMNLRDLREPEPRSFLEQQLRQAEEQDGVIYETTHQRKDGTTFPIEVSARLIDIQGEKFYQHIIRDISERKEAEARVLKEKQFSDSVINSLPGLFYLFDKEGRFLRWNQNLEILTGYSAGEIAKMSPLEFFPVDEQYRVAEKIQETFMKGKATVEAYLISKKGERTPYFLTGVHLKLEEQDYLIGMGVDITQRKQIEEQLVIYREHLEELVHERTIELESATRQLQKEMNERIVTADALRESEEKYKSIIDNIGMGIALISPDMEILSLNRLMQQWFLPIETGNKPVCYRAFNTPPKDEICSYCPTCRTLQDGRVHISMKETPVNGEIRSYRIISSPVRNREGTIIAAIEMVEDVTEEKRSAEEIVRLNEALRNNILQLENINKELESFSYSVSHDLRAPLRSIDGFSKILVEDYGGKLDEEGRHYIQRVRNASQRMGQLIDDLLDLSRVSRQDMRIEAVDLSSLANTIAKELRNTSPGRQVEFILQEGITVYGDNRLFQILLENLFSNAMKFTARTEEARIEFGAEDQVGELVYFVRDNGVGFDMTYSDKLFGAFQRLHSQDEFPGTGIGLAIVQRIVNRHSGRIWAHGVVGEGATFFFTLPGK
jgi:PAS domain S-box-containing protein